MLPLCRRQSNLSFFCCIHTPQYGWEADSKPQTEVGYIVGAEVGFAVGVEVGYIVGAEVGYAVGVEVGYIVGIEVG